MQAIDLITIDGYKSIRHVDLKLRPLNILIGANGAGKSNFVSVFRFIKELVDGNLDFHVAKAGGAETFLHFGRKVTDELYIGISFVPNSLPRLETCSFTLTPTSDHKFIKTMEVASFQNEKDSPVPIRIADHKPEIQLNEAAETPYRTIDHHIREAINSWRIYHFHDTSETARIKQPGDINDNRFLRSDGSNLAAYLYLLRETEPQQYRNVVGTIRLMAPFFDDFSLRPDPLTNQQKIRLEWQERNMDTYFDAHALSDGTLRFMCLATLLQQPPDMLPSTILLDEPELGLHPYAITLLANMLQSAAEHTQVIVSTQSVTLVNQFGTEDIIVVEREDGQSVFRHLSEEEVESWLEDYGLGDLWEKNVIGGRPAG